MGNAMIKHGHSSGGNWSPEYACWKNLRRRCCDPNNRQYPDYGGRGISVCARWYFSFENFYEDMGPRPSPDHSIERIENNGNYEPGNCKWATRAEQNRNRRNTHFVMLGDERLCLAEAVRVVGLDRSTIRRRLKRGWDMDRALTTPCTPHSVRRWPRPAAPCNAARGA